MTCRFGKGRTYDEGYQSLGCIASYSPLFKLQSLFLDVQMIRVGRGKLAGNFGVGWRQIILPDYALIGMNFFYDMRRQSQHTFQQVGMGLEYFTNLLDLRLNGYLPIGAKEKSIGNGFFDYGDGYSITIEEFRNAMWGIDFEIGKCFRFCKKLPLFVGIGPYFYDIFENGCCPHGLIGGMGRLTAKMCRIAMFECLYAYDRINKNCLQLQLTFDISFLNLCSLFSYPSSCKQDFCIPNRRVERNPIIFILPTCGYQIHS
jgi:hypothetical protein